MTKRTKIGEKDFGVDPETLLEHRVQTEDGDEAAGGDRPYGRSITILTAGAIIAFLYFARDVFVPLSLALLLSFLLATPCAFLERVGFKRTLAVILCVGFAFVSVLSVTWLVSSQFYGLAKTLPRYRMVIEKKLKAFKVSPEGTMGQLSQVVTLTAEELKAPENTLTNAALNKSGTNALVAAARSTNEPIEVRQAPQGTWAMLSSVLGPVLKPIGTAFMVFVVLTFMLHNREDMRNRIISLAGTDRMDLTTDTLDEAAEKVIHYLYMQIVVNCCFGLLIGTGLYLIKVPSPWLWGVLGLILRFVPYVGAWIAAFPPLLLAFAIDPGWGKVTWTMGLFGSVELITSNAVEPLLYGASTGVTPVALLLSAVFWTWLWGPIGLLLSTPLTVCLAVIGIHISQLRFLHILLSDAPILSIETQFYQRLRALDRQGTEIILDAYLKEKTLEETYEKLMLPALNYAKEDFSLNRLSVAKQKGIFDYLKELTLELAEGRRHEALSNKSDSITPKMGTSRIAIIPAKGLADEIAGIMFKETLASRGIMAEEFSEAALINENLHELAQHHIKTVCISVVPPDGLRRARYLGKRIQLACPGIKVVIGFWGATSEMVAKCEDHNLGKPEGILTTFDAAAATVVTDVTLILT